MRPTMASRGNYRYRLLLRAMIVVGFLTKAIKSGQGGKEADLGGATEDIFSSLSSSSSKRSTSSLSSRRSFPRICAAWSGSSRTDTSFPLVHLNFCLDCSNPAAEGSVVLGLAPHHGLRNFRVGGDVVLAVPNNCQSDILNGEEMIGRIVLVDRGEVSVVKKALKIQAAGGKGVIVIDDGGCSEGLVDCGRFGGVEDGGFARLDGAHAWLSVTIPVILVSEAVGQRLKGMMRLQTILVEGLGEQLVEQR